MSSEFYLINAFTDKEFKGNPAAIIVLSEKKTDEWIESVAKELNQPITTFISKKEHDSYRLRWFTPKKEIELCGHGTLGAAHVLWSEGLSSIDSTIHFDTKSGILQAKRTEKQIGLRFKLKESSPIPITEKLKRSINFPIKSAAWAEDRYILELENENMIHHVKPNLEMISSLEGTGVIITSHGSDKYDFVSRYFAPKIGIHEDHVTGSAHCALASYWKKRLNKEDFLAYQDSKRGGELLLKISGEYVQIMGNCIILLKGQLYI